MFYSLHQYIATLVYERRLNVLRIARENVRVSVATRHDTHQIASSVVRYAERCVSLIVPNRPTERSATHGLKHAALWARAAKNRHLRYFNSERDETKIALYAIITNNDRHN